MISENEKNQLRFRNFDWRLNLVTDCRSKQRVMLPKYTIQLELEKMTGSEAQLNVEGKSDEEEAKGKTVLVDREI